MPALRIRGIGSEVLNQAILYISSMGAFSAPSANNLIFKSAADHSRKEIHTRLLC
jgi:hypothetical protein